MRFEVKIQDIDADQSQMAKMSVVHFVDIQANQSSNFPVSYLEEPEPKNQRSSSPIYVVNMLNMCQEHKLERNILFKNNSLNLLTQIICG